MRSRLRARGKEVFVLVHGFFHGHLYPCTDSCTGTYLTRCTGFIVRINFRAREFVRKNSQETIGLLVLPNLM